MISTSIENQVKRFCARIGTDRLLVQGPGGNVSWKQGDLLWIKASGMWLADAQRKDIFVPVDLAHLNLSISALDFSVTPRVAGISQLRPSIETLLHALMPHKVVAHIHAVDLLVHLVQRDAEIKVKQIVGDSVRSTYISYFKPGADLARAVYEQLDANAAADVLFLANHGIVIGGSNIEIVASTLQELTKKFKKNSPVSVPGPTKSKRATDLFSKGYHRHRDEEVNLLAIKKEWLERLRYSWALYPDHVVFLGAKPAILEENFDALELDAVTRRQPPFIFVATDGVYQNLNLSHAQDCQLRCYADVIFRQENDSDLVSLSDQQVYDLLGWEAENYRKNFLP